jgi:hypothetical protein
MICEAEFFLPAEHKAEALTELKALARSGEIYVDHRARVLEADVLDAAIPEEWGAEVDRDAKDEGEDREDEAG